ncbi:MAG: hypothetical protein Q7K48_04175 [Fusobacterium sp. JB021]|nr:hypothetical protein [Fusobacterium sp. JB021]
MIYFLYGDIPLQLKYEVLINKLRKEHHNLPEKIFDASQDDMEFIFQALSSNNMFIPLELIVIKNLDKIKNLSKFFKGLKEFNYSKKIVILMYNEFFNDFGTVQNEVSKTILKSAEKICKLVSARKADEKKSLLFYIKEKLNCSDYDAEKFLEMIGEDFIKLKNEINKVNNFFNRNPFNLEKAIPILSINKEFNLNLLCQELIYKKKHKNLILNLKSTKNYMLFLNIISEEITILMKLKNLEERGIISSNINFNLFKNKIYPTIKEIFKNKNRYMHPYPLFLKFQYLKLFEFNFLEKKLNECLEAEFNFKSGLTESFSSIELFIINFNN